MRSDRGGGLARHRQSAGRVADEQRLSLAVRSARRRVADLGAPARGCAGRALVQARDLPGPPPKASPRAPSTTTRATTTFACRSTADEPTQDALDAVSCASVFNSDKGRYITDADVAARLRRAVRGDGSRRTGRMRAALARRRCIRRARDVEARAAPTASIMPTSPSYRRDAREVMPEIDAVTMATPPGECAAEACCSRCRQAGRRATTRDASRSTSKATTTPASTTNVSTARPVDCPKVVGHVGQCATGYGYPYRGQPSVVYCLDFAIGGDSTRSFETAQPTGSARTGTLPPPASARSQPMDGMTDDPVNAPGSGGDRLQRDPAGGACEPSCARRAVQTNRAPSAIGDLHWRTFPTSSTRTSGRAELPRRGRRRRSVPLRRALLDRSDHRRQLFIRGQPAKNATTAAEALRVPRDAPAGTPIRVDIGGLVASTHYYIGVRAVDGCGETARCRSWSSLPRSASSPPSRRASSPRRLRQRACGRVGVLRRLRDRQLANHALGRAFVSAYWRVGPGFAARIRHDERLRTLARWVLTPVVAAARALEEWTTAPNYAQLPIGALVASMPWA